MTQVQQCFSQSRDLCLSIHIPQWVVASRNGSPLGLQGSRAPPGQGYAQWFLATTLPSCASRFFIVLAFDFPASTEHVVLLGGGTAASSFRKSNTKIYPNLQSATCQRTTPPLCHSCAAVPQGCPCGVRPALVLGLQASGSVRSPHYTATHVQQCFRAALAVCALLLC